MLTKKIFYPFNGVDDIKFGTNRESLRNLLHDNYIEFTRNEFSENTSDFYKDINIFVEYDTNNICQAIEFAAYNILLLDNKNLFEFAYSELIEHYGLLSTKQDIEDENHIIFHDLGFGATKKQLMDEVKSILIFSKNYWL